MRHNRRHIAFPLSPLRRRMTETGFDALIAEIRKRYVALQGNVARLEQFIAHLRSLGHWEHEPMDATSVPPPFPDKIEVALAVCHPDCGTRQLVVDDGTPECYWCGRLMFRLATKSYHR